MLLISEWWASELMVMMMGGLLPDAENLNTCVTVLRIKIIV